MDGIYQDYLVMYLGKSYACKHYEKMLILCEGCTGPLPSPFERPNT